MTNPQNKPLVTVLCGFLGAGKTTLLKHLLGQAEGRKWAAIVNDVAALNIDAAVVRAASGGDIVEMGNGCVCCSSKDELAETVAELAATGRYEHILIETTGVAEPRGIANLFTRKNPFGRTLDDFAMLSALVSVIDVAAFASEFLKAEQAKSRQLSETTGARPVFELMLEQVECADVLVMNPCDRVTAEEADRIEAILCGLNARAEIVRSWRETCELNKGHPQAAELFNPDKLPAFHDPFAGGGALPLEAQRLGLESFASDLNPVAVTINKAMIEIPPRFAGRKPIGPRVERDKQGKLFLK